MISILKESKNIDLEQCKISKHFVHKSLSHTSNYHKEVSHLSSWASHYAVKFYNVKMEGWIELSVKSSIDSINQVDLDYQCYDF